MPNPTRLREHHDRRSYIGRARLASTVSQLVLLAFLSGCASLLPDAKSETRGGWRDFDEAKLAIEAIEPYVTTRERLKRIGIDPYSNASITLLTYADIIQRFAAGAAVRPDNLERGIRDCLNAGKACTAFSITQRTVKRDRVGNFWLDSFSFRREVDVSGWSFNALILMVDDLVVYTLFGGQPKIQEHELTRNPLGPLQSWGDQLAPQLRR